MTTQHLKKIKSTGLVNLKALCESAEVNYNTISSKLDRGTELSRHLICATEAEHWEVAGNVFENPELLEVAE